MPYVYLIHGSGCMLGDPYVTSCAEDAFKHILRLAAFSRASEICVNCSRSTFFVFSCLPR